MFATRIHRLRDITDLLQIFVNKEYARLTGDSPVEAKVADAENDGDPGSREPLSVTQIFAEAGRQDLRRVRFILHCYRLTGCNLDPLVLDGLSLRNTFVHVSLSWRSALSYPFTSEKIKTEGIPRERRHF